MASAIACVIFAHVFVEVKGTPINQLNVKLMKKSSILLLTVLALGLMACTSGTKKNVDMENETKVKIETSMGDIVVKLYNETPKHRDNFIKLAEEGTYEGTLFHRVIKDFMIQAGDPESKTAPKGQMLGAGDVGYTIPAEYV